MSSASLRLLRAWLPLFVFFGASASSPLAASDPPVSCADLLSQAIAVNQSVGSLSLTLLARERMNGKLELKKSFFKIENKPYRVYVKQFYPKSGLEAIYPDKNSSGKIVVHWSKLSFIKLHLDPFSKPFKKSGHHTIDRAGYRYTMEVLNDLQLKFPFTSDVHWQYNGAVKYADIPCLKITFDNPDFRLLNYTVKKGDDLSSVAARYRVSEYMIADLNPDAQVFEVLRPGSIIKIPSDYARQIIIYLNKQNYTLTGLKIYDDQGLFEEYTFLDVKINPAFSNLDFDTENPEYGF